MAKRFGIGWQKYGLGNCYQAIGTGDLDFIRSFIEHAHGHLDGFIRTVVNGPDTEKDGRTEGPLDHLGACMWNCGMLITYTLRDPRNVKKAFNTVSLLKKSEESAS